MFLTIPIRIGSVSLSLQNLGAILDEVSRLPWRPVLPVLQRRWRVFCKLY
jgi:hypothetical protein